MLTRRSLLAAAIALPKPDLLILSLPTAQLLENRWSEDPEQPAQPGSLWKPFLAAAHAGPSPRYHCDGSQCWLGRRHGWLDMPGALAQSCNQWFHQLLPTLPRPLTLIGLPTPSGNDWPQWPIPPLQLARAYAELLARKDDHPLVIAGLRLASEQGTAKALGRHFLAKTGTGPSKLHSGDGWVFAANGTRLYLYRQRGVTGAQAAAALARERL